ncbi:hypothetical protein Vafri_18923 [Volvox africanus]|uniref:Pseudouridine synthase I TruA alpha/beta domain-containing protein n=1 Tax=Volvox africanus TaxID=51714 RepID=A0A8J4F942_9CHLO|nr:hypothetical protein Vafri_18923 [Volvox africanus]
MDENCSSIRADLLQRLQSLTQHAATDDTLPLPDLANQLTELANHMRLASRNAALPPAPRAATCDTAMDTGPRGAVQGAPTDAAAFPGQQPSKKQRRAPREFDFSRYRTRFVALELMYVGWSFQGFARQDNTENTIEGVLFSALRKVKLVPEAAATPISDLNYSRCGRTDRGVSALGQVVALRLRSSARVDEPEAPLELEYDYPRLVNKALPPEVRVLGWAPVPAEFNARFCAQYREYKYFIVQQRLQPSPPPPPLPPAHSEAKTASAATLQPGGDNGAISTHAVEGSGEAQGGPSAEPLPGPVPDPEPNLDPDSVSDLDPGTSCCSFLLDIDAMRAAAAHFVGEHDFRNFCKPDVATVRSFRRRILSFTINPVSTSTADKAHQVFAMTVRGTAFLWHQVRCMAAVLLMVGRGQERPEIVSKLLDVETTPRKPQYSMAPEEPLLLYACGFSSLRFRRSTPAMDGTMGDVAGLMHRHLIGAALTAACHSRLTKDDRCTEDVAAARSGVGGSAPHIPLERRQTEPSVEERMARRGLPWPPEPRQPGRGEGTGGADEEGEDDAMME